MCENESIESIEIIGPEMDLDSPAFMESDYVELQLKVEQNQGESD